MASRSDKFWGALDRFRTSRMVVALFFVYPVGVLIAAILASLAIRGNHALAAEANAAATKANIAAAVATRSLCFQKRAAIGQLAAAKRFLHEHPDGTTDFSRGLIMNAIHNDGVDVAALRDVRCRDAQR